MMPDNTGHIQEKHKSVPTLGSLASRLTTPANEIHSSSSVVVNTSTEETNRFDQATKRKQKTPQQAERAREKQWRTRRMKRAQKAESQRAYISNVENSAASKSEDDDNEPLDQESSVAASPPTMPEDKSKDLNDEGPILKAMLQELRGLGVDPTSSKDLKNHGRCAHDKFIQSCRECVFQISRKTFVDDLILVFILPMDRLECWHVLFGLTEVEVSKFYNTLYSDLSAMLLEADLSYLSRIPESQLAYRDKATPGLHILTDYRSYVLDAPWALEKRRSILKKWVAYMTDEGYLCPFLDLSLS